MIRVMTIFFLILLFFCYNMILKGNEKKKSFSTISFLTTKQSIGVICETLLINSF